MTLGRFPKYLCYDNSCQFSKFCKNRKVRTERSAFLEDLTYVIDRLHVQGHVKACRDVFAPALIKDLDDAQTMICEQRNFWISGFKHNVKHMNQYRFEFFLYVIFSHFNQVKCDGLINIGNTNDVYKPSKKLTTLVESSGEEDLIVNSTRNSKKRRVK